jgi:hypothetical protein
LQALSLDASAACSEETKTAPRVLLQISVEAHFQPDAGFKARPIFSSPPVFSIAGARRSAAPDGEADTMLLDTTTYAAV